MGNTGTTFDSQFNDFMDMWDAAQQDDEFHTKPQHDQTDITSDELDPDDVFSQLGGVVDMPPEGVLNEDNTPNPVFPDSVGVDQTQPEARWVNEDLIKQVKGLKDRLFKVENELAKLGNKRKIIEKPVEMEINKNKPAMSKIAELRKQIDVLSNELGIKGEPSPWKTPKKG